MLRQLTATPFACSALDLPRSVPISRREHAMLSLVRFARLVIFFKLFLGFAKPVLVINGIKLICVFQIRRKMVEIMRNQASSCDLKELVAKFIPESIGREIEKATSSIFPLQNVFIRKVKILKAPKFDIGKLMEV